ncbi:hypothetical protein F0358_15090 [Empedobacter brevis]|uniref:hypothetical protein n=1 Tax=Empedobacter brevis TaxID=247 RepID=UPI00123E1940|nr:hypothetical protein [Empedobacter brevis]QES93946.1 hypothetical protein F0358_15090 [Empedobacter brevis]
MKRNILLLYLFILCPNAYSQVGINTTDPRVTLDVEASPNISEVFDGVLIPRISGNHLYNNKPKYTNQHRGTLIYVTSKSDQSFRDAPLSQVVNVDSEGFYYFDGNRWQKIVSEGTNMVEPWQIIGTNRPATKYTQNIYQKGKVSFGKNASAGSFSFYNTDDFNYNRVISIINEQSSNNDSGLGRFVNTDLYMESKSPTISGVKPYTSFMSNLGSGQMTTLSYTGANSDRGIIFSTDGDGYKYSKNGFVIAPHVGGGGATPFGLKVNEQGMVSINAQTPTETLDIATGTVRVRNLPINGKENAIYTQSNGKSSLPDTVEFSDLKPITKFTGTRTVIANGNGVLGYVVGLPVTKTSTGLVIIENLPIYENNSDANSLAEGTLYRTSTGNLMVKY